MRCTTACRSSNIRTELQFTPSPAPFRFSKTCSHGAPNSLSCLKNSAPETGSKTGNPSVGSMPYHYGPGVGLRCAAARFLNRVTAAFARSECLEDFMRRGFRVLAGSAVVAAATIIMHADAQVPSQLSEIQLRLARVLFEQGQYPESLEAYRSAVSSDDSGTSRRARAGVIQAALRVAEFSLARREAEELVKISPRDAETLALYGDSLWAAGLFDKAEEQYRDALSMQADLARGRHGIARSLLARTKLDEALNEAQAALRDRKS